MNEDNDAPVDHNEEPPPLLSRNLVQYNDDDDDDDLLLLPTRLSIIAIRGHNLSSDPISTLELLIQLVP